MSANTLNRKQLKKLAEEVEALADWTTMRDFASQMYGEGKAAKIETETYGEYNDEGGTDYSITSITAYDSEGNELAFDHSLPFFSLEAWKSRNKDDDDMDKLKEVWFSSKNEKENREDWILIEDLPVDVHNGGDETYDLTTIPALTTPH